MLNVALIVIGLMAIGLVIIGYGIYRGIKHSVLATMYEVGHKCTGSLNESLQVQISDIKKSLEDHKSANNYFHNVTYSKIQKDIVRLIQDNVKPNAIKKKKDQRNWSALVMEYKSRKNEDRKLTIKAFCSEKGISERTFRRHKNA